MTTQPNTLEQPIVRAQIKALILEGVSDSEIARTIGGVTRQAIFAWRKRHAAELAPVIAAMEKSIEDYAIAQKVRRIAAMDDRWQRGMQLIAVRAGDARFKEPGYETGLMVHRLKVIGSGKFTETVDEYAVDTGLLASLLALEEKAAAEMGQLPRAESAAAARLKLTQGDQSIEFVLEIGEGDDDGSA